MSRGYHAGMDNVLHESEKPKPMENGRLLMAFDGWMDGGEVSTGTLDWLVEQLGARQVAAIDPEPFNIYNFPGSMEVAAMFRPHVKMEEGLVKDYVPPSLEFYVAESSQLLLFSGREPNFHWQKFGHVLLNYAEAWGVQRMYFVGSVAGAVPHTREPRLFSSVSHAHLRDELKPFLAGFSNYEGPASMVTYLLIEAKQRNLELATLVAEIPAYIQGRNAKSIESVVRKLSAILGIGLDMTPLRKLSDHWERRLNEAIDDREDLLEHIQQLEADYDNEVFDTQLGDLKDWLQERGIEVD